MSILLEELPQARRPSYNSGIWKEISAIVSAIPLWFSTMRVISCILLLACSASAQDSLSEGIDAYRQGHLLEARTHLEASLKQHPDSQQAKAFLAMVLAGSGDCAAQISALQNVWKSAAPPDVRRLAGLAALQCSIAQKTPDSGFPLFIDLKKAYPSDPDVLYLGAKLYMLGWNEQVAGMFAKAPGSYRVNQLSAEVFETQGNYSEAAGEYAKAIQKNPTAIGLHFRRGRVTLLSSHDAPHLEQALKEFESELTLNPEDAAAEFQIGQILDIQGNSLAASKHFERATTLRPDFPEALLAVAKYRARQHQYSDAIGLLERVIKFQPENEAAHYNLMLAYRNAGNPGAAAREKERLDQIQKPPAGEFADFLKKLDEKRPQP